MGQRVSLCVCAHVCVCVCVCVRVRERERERKSGKTLCVGSLSINFGKKSASVLFKSNFFVEILSGTCLDSTGSHLVRLVASFCDNFKN